MAVVFWPDSGYRDELRKKVTAALQIDSLDLDPVDAPTRELLSRLIREHMRHHLRPILAAVGFMFLVSGTTIAFAKLIEPILDGVFEAGDESIILPIALALVTIGLIRGLAVFGQRMTMATASPSAASIKTSSSLGWRR
jgi:hypothetical protein